jgi:polar amino acid transport system substrate-binding protein
MKKFIVLTVVLTALLHLTGCAGNMAANTVFSGDDLKDKKIGVAKNTAATYYADGYGTLQQYDSSETMLVDLKNGGIDCAVMDEALAKSLTKKVAGLKILPQPLVETEFRFAIAKENPDLLEAVNAALKELKESGTLQKIIEGYQPGNDYRYVSPENIDLSHGTLTLAVDAAMPPYSYYDSQNLPAGLHIDIARAVCDLLQVAMDVSVVGSSDLVLTVQYGKADLSLGGAADDEENAKLAVFSNPYTTSTQVIVTRR